MKRLLVCTDLSTESDVVVKAAEEMRQRHEGKIDLLYVTDTGLHLANVFSHGPKETFHDVVLKNFKLNLEEKLNDQVARTGVKANILIKDGSVSEIITSIADEGQHDLIIMGHGRKNILHQILGSNAVKVIGSSPLPLLIIKKPIAFNKIAGLIDESRPMDKLMIGTFNFMKNFGVKEAEFIALWIDYPKPLGAAEEGHLVKEKVQGEADYFSHPGAGYEVKALPTKEVKLADPLRKILIEDHVDIAVLRRFTEGNLKRVYIGSTSRRLLETFEGNLLIIPPSQPV